MKRTKLIALLAALVAAFALWNYLNNQTVKQSAEMDYQEAIVAEVTIRKGDIIQSGKLAVRKIPGKYLPAGTLKRMSEASGKVAQSDIGQGEIITYERLSNPENGLAGLAYKIPEGSRAITLNVGIEAGLAGMIVPGNHVDILISYMEPDNGTEQENTRPEGEIPGEAGAQEVAETPEAAAGISTFYLLEDVTVLACGQFMNEETLEQLAAGTGTIYDSITLSVTREEAESIESYTFKARQSNGNIRLILRAMEQEADASVNDGVEEHEY